MDEEIGIIIFIVFLITGLILFATWAIIQGQKAKEEEIEEQRKIEEELKKEAEERREQEEERLKEEEWKNSTLCVICENHSYGDVICSDCWDRRLVIKKELPYKRVCTYELINEYKNELMCKIVFPETQLEREINSVKLLAVAEILNKKYCQSNALDKTQAFLEDVVDEIESTEELLEKYQLKSETVSEEKKNNEQEEKQNDYRASHPKPYRCEDGDYVRSKAEREIDNFLFQNRIWHVYESEYVNPQDNKKYYPDFFLPDHNLYIEYFGLTDDKYIEKMKEKIRMYESDKNIQFVAIDHNDDSNIGDRLKQICQQFNLLEREEKTLKSNKDEIKYNQKEIEILEAIKNNPEKAEAFLELLK